MRDHEIAVYYFPGYHPDPRNDRWQGEGWTEWELVRRAEPRFPGHRQPRVPLWGYLDESKPAVAERQISAAADHGVTAFIYDWYWYDNGPFLNRALENGFLRAANNDRLKFSLMWANHDWRNIFPQKRGMPTHVLAEGRVSRGEFDAAADYVIRNYFSHPSYWKIEDRPYFSIYELNTLVEDLGGEERAREALEGFREKTKASGLPDVHLNAVVWGIGILPGERVAEDQGSLLTRLGFDSVTSYVWIHHVPLDGFPTVPYPEYTEKAAEGWRAHAERFDLPYYPNVTVGWDSSPRTVQSDVFEDLGYPFTPVLTGNTPEEFGGALKRARAFLDASPVRPRVLTINAWNEWTEGSYLEPDTVHGMGYLEAVRDVFGPENLERSRG